MDMYESQEDEEYLRSEYEEQVKKNTIYIKTNNVYIKAENDEIPIDISAIKPEPKDVDAAEYNNAETQELDDEEDSNSGGKSKRKKKVKRKHLIHFKEKQVIGCMIRALELEKQQNKLLHPLSAPMKRVETYTGKNLKTLNKIKTDLSMTNSSTVSTKVKTNFEIFDQEIIRRTIDEFYIQKRTIPTLVKLKSVLENRINLNLCTNTLVTVLKNMGYTWKMTASLPKKRVLIERPDIIDWRCSYLTKIKTYRSEGRHIVYLDETWIDNNLNFHKCWPYPSENYEQQFIKSSKNNILLVNIGTADGFLNNSQLVCKINIEKGETFVQWNVDTFTKWIENKVIQNLPTNSIIVMDNAPYHSSTIDDMPTRYSTKEIMINWLKRKGYPVNMTFRKTLLYDLIKKNQPKQIEYEIDQLLSNYGHIVIRLPPYNNLNPIQMIWDKMRIYIQSNYIREMDQLNIEQLIYDAMNSILIEDWKNCFEHVVILEKQYWERDGIVEEIIDDIVGNLEEEISDFEEYDTESSSESD